MSADQQNMREGRKKKWLSSSAVASGNVSALSKSTAATEGERRFFGRLHCGLDKAWLWIMNLSFNNT